MNDWPPESELKKFYGNPDVNGDGVADRAWEDANLIRIIPPYEMVTSWDADVKLKRIAVHKKCADVMLGCLEAIANLYPTAELRELHGLNLFGGCYNFRRMRGGSRLSTHSYACAIDLDPVGNPLGKAWSPGMIPMSVVEIFEAAGATWGGRWSRPDCQHFQFARTG